MWKRKKNYFTAIKILGIERTESLPGVAREMWVHRSDRFSRIRMGGDCTNFKFWVGCQ
jgi:hypothetical protein